MSGQQKRPRGTPTFLTPTRPTKRTPHRFLRAGSARRRLGLPIRPEAICDESGSSKVRSESWSKAEIKALVQFIVCNAEGQTWPMHRRMDFWDRAALYVFNQAGITHQRSGSSCRFKVVKWLKKKFHDPKSAEIFYVSSVSVGTQTTAASSPTEGSADCVDVGVQTVVPSSCEHQLRDMGVQSEEEHADLHTLSVTFSEHCKRVSEVDVGSDFLEVSSAAMARLKFSGRSNVVYNLAKGIGTIRKDEAESLFPVGRMPMGLVEYTINFFIAENINTVPRCPVDYRSWLQTMYCQFGQKWAKLHHGPMWSVDSSDHNERERQTTKALVNVPALSERTHRRDIAASEVTLDAQIQYSVLDEAAKANPNTWWWIKADGADLVSGLCESVKGVWSGDVDLADGAVQKAYVKYQQRLTSITELGRSSRATSLQITEDLTAVEQETIQDTIVVSSMLKKLSDEYSQKQQQERAVEKGLFKLAWDVQQLGELNKTGRQLVVNCGSLKEKLLQPSYDRISDNFARKLSNIKQDLLSFTKEVAKYKRTAATHVLVVMISPEERNRKPYALPVQCLAYASLGDMAVRRICDLLIKEMSNRGMKVAGFATNGEWNSLRSKGYERPLSVFEIRASVRRKYRSLSFSSLVGMITPTSLSDGSLAAMNAKSIVSLETLKEISMWQSEGCSMKDIITRLRLRTVPQGYSHHTWIAGKEEDEADMLRSILAQFEYSLRVKQHCSDGVPFDKYLHIPETHKLTGTVVCQREDEGHLFKRIATSLRQGRVDDVCLQRFVEALQDPDTNLTYPALTGVRKQSVQDVERLFGSQVIEFMERKNYTQEAKFLRVVRNWRRAIDERGLEGTQRQQFLHDFKAYICADLMPWYDTGLRDFSLMEVNRPLDRVRGFTRETLIGVCASIETRQWRYHFNSANHIPPEHPRASTTDDVECFFSVLRDCVGKNFTLKQVYYEWRKVALEFSKRMDSSLPFYYYTDNHRFYEGEMPGFNEPHVKPAKEDRPPRRELLAGSIGRRASFPVRSSLSVRAKFHNVPVDLPPPPNSTPAERLRAEHSYY